VTLKGAVTHNAHTIPKDVSERGTKVKRRTRDMLTARNLSMVYPFAHVRVMRMRAPLAARQATI